MIRTITTNCLAIRDGKILLGMKKRGFGQGRWNGFGGKLLNNETIEESAKREIVEECGIIVQKIKLQGVLEFKYIGDKQELVEVNVFLIKNFIGEPKESEEMKPQWFNLNEIPFSQMWPDDKYWMPLFLAGKKFKGKFIFKGHDDIISHKLNVVE